MNKWESIQKKYKFLERLSIVFIFFLFLIGGYFDWRVLVENDIWIKIDDIESFSLTILQIQAAIATLSIAIIALIAGSISETHMGVAISDFYLNIRPWKLTQKNIIFVTLFLCLIGVVFQSLRLYNCVFSVLVATLIVIYVSVVEIYAAFKGKKQQIEEIEAYINYVIESEICVEKTISLYQTFVLDWCEKIELQNKQTYEKFYELFKKFIKKIWSYNRNESIVEIQTQSYSIACCLLSSEKALLNERGILFVEETYETIWEIVSNDISEGKGYFAEFSLFNEIVDELRNSIEKLDAENVERILNLYNIFNYVQSVAIWMIKDKNLKKDESFLREYSEYEATVSELSYLARCMGYYLRRQRTRGNVVNELIWARYYKRWGLYDIKGLPNERYEMFLWDKTKVFFDYTYGMLLSGNENIVKQGMYVSGTSIFNFINSKYQALLCVAVHCYIYYLAEREENEYVSENTKNDARNILNDKKVKNVFLNFIDEIIEHLEWLDAEFYKRLYKLVSKYELYPQYDSIKRLTLPEVISDFYIFIILYISSKYNYPDLLDKNIDGIESFSYIRCENQKATREMLASLLKIIYVEEKDDKEILNDVETMYDNLEKNIKNKQKDIYIKIAKDEEENYKHNVGEKEICDKIKTDVYQRITEKFAPILMSTSEDVKPVWLNLRAIRTNTSFLENKGVEGYYPEIEGKFLDEIIDFLFEHNYVEVKDRYDDYANDKEYIDYLTKNRIKVLLGRKSILKNLKYKFSNEFNKLLEDCETVYTTFINRGLGLRDDAIKICLHDIRVSIHIPEIKDFKVQFNEENQTYIYSIIDNIPIEFEEEELKEYLSNKFKNINISVLVSMHIKKEMVGTAFVIDKSRENIYMN